MRDKEWKILDENIAAAAKARLQASMELYCDTGPDGFQDSLFKFLQHYERESIKVRLEEFKAKGVRLLGFNADDGGTSTFFVTGADADKKRAKVNPTLIDVAGREAVRVVRILRKQAEASKGKQR